MPVELSFSTKFKNVTGKRRWDRKKRVLLFMFKLFELKLRKKKVGIWDRNNESPFSGAFLSPLTLDSFD